MTWDWKREFERQHGKIPSKGKARQNHGHDDQAAEEAEGAAARAPDRAAGGDPAADDHMSSKRVDDHGVPESRPDPVLAAAVELGRRVAARKAELKQAGEAKTGEPILSLLGSADIKHLDSMAKEAGKERAQLAADLLADVLADDAEAHEGAA